MGHGRDFQALGLMSGTSLDGIDAALLRTDGERVLETGPALTLAYDEPFRERLRACLGSWDAPAEVERELTLHHAEAVRRLLDLAGLPASEIDVIGFHGQTILHRPDQRRTRQIGDGALLAGETGIDVVADFRSADVAAGGQGAPLVPLFHAALAHALERPLAVLNLGGVGNLTWIGEGGALIAFDTGPGNALIDDWALRHTGRAVDEDGRLAAAGRADEARVGAFLGQGYFAAHPPKSLDRDDFRRHAAALVEGMGAADGAATLTAFTAASVAAALAHLPARPRRWLACGGGRRNPVLMADLRRRLGAPVQAVEEVGWDGDALEAQAFGFLAVRSLRGLPLTLPETTGVPVATAGGRVFASGSSGR